MQNMRISIANDKPPMNNEPCHGDPPQVNGRTGLVGCFEECFTPDTNTGSVTGDYLLIPGGLYEIPTASGSAQGKLYELYKNDYYCGEGLASKDGMVRVDMPGPVTVRSGHISFTRIESHY